MVNDPCGSSSPEKDKDKVIACYNLLWSVPLTEHAGNHIDAQSRLSRGQGGSTGDCTRLNQAIS